MRNPNPIEYGKWSPPAEWGKRSPKFVRVQEVALPSLTWSKFWTIFACAVAAWLFVVLPLALLIYGLVQRLP